MVELDKDIMDAIVKVQRQLFKPSMTIHRPNGDIHVNFDSVEDVKAFTEFLEEMFNGMKAKALEQAHKYALEEMFGK